MPIQTTLHPLHFPPSRRPTLVLAPVLALAALCLPALPLPAQAQTAGSGATVQEKAPQAGSADKVQTEAAGTRPATPSAATSAAPSPPSAATATATPPVTPRRPRIGLVLSGGGARGLSHVGVLKVLERERIPIDVIAGTSMGAIVGGLYASGMGADALEAELLKIDWGQVFASRVQRQELSQRRKEEDFEISPAIEIGLRDGQLRMPLGALSGRGLESLLRRFTLPVRNVQDFDRLPIPFRAVATNMETGQGVVLGAGDLALALRSSMSVPGVFAPTEVDDQILGDGGLVNNLPVDVARAMGADRLIVVNIGTPLSPRSTLGTVGGLTAQMINILTEQNVQRSLATLGSEDVLIQPQLADLGSGDFDRTAQLIGLGEQGALANTFRLQPLALDTAGYQQWRHAHQGQAPAPATVSFVRFEGSEHTNPARFADQLESRVGQAFDAAQAERDTRRLAASGDYMRADYLLLSTPAGDGLVFDLEDKPWGPNYLRIGLDLSTDFRGDGGFNIKISHNRHWLDQAGSEWRNLVQIGRQPRWFSELYHPLSWNIGLSNDWFVAAYGDISRRELDVYNSPGGERSGRFNRGRARLGVDLGQPWGQLGELRLGLTRVWVHNEPEVVSADHQGPRVTTISNEAGLRAGMVIDQLDFANFPQRGYRLDAEVVTGWQRDSLQPDRQRFTRSELEGTAATSHGPHTLNLHLRAQQIDRNLGGLGRFSLGGFHQLSGYREGQIEGNALLFGRLTYYLRLRDTPLLTRGFFVGGTLEAGNAWQRRDQASLSDLRSGMSLFVGADTGLGPLYFGITHARGGSTGLNLFIGRP